MLAELVQLLRSVMESQIICVNRLFDQRLKGRPSMADLVQNTFDFRSISKEAAHQSLFLEARNVGRCMPTLRQH